MSNAPFTRDSAGRIVTDRLRLRLWVDADRAPFRAMNRDPRVMAHFPCLLFDDQSDRRLDAMYAFLAANGIGLWAVERLSDNALLGFAGIQPVNIGVAFDGEAELSWRLEPRFWGQGYAAEASRVALWIGFEEKQLPRVLATTVPGNDRAIGLAAKLGLTPRPDLDFDHPDLAPGHPRAPHIVFGIERP